LPGLRTKVHLPRHESVFRRPGGLVLRSHHQAGPARLVSDAVDVRPRGASALLATASRLRIVSAAGVRAEGFVVPGVARPVANQSRLFEGGKASPPVSMDRGASLEPTLRLDVSNRRAYRDPDRAVAHGFPSRMGAS